MMHRIQLVATAMACVAVAACSQPLPPGELRPSDFARGVAVSPPPNVPFFRLDAPADLFTQTAWGDQRDIRVFNASGAMVPFARMETLPASNKGRRVQLRSFRLQEQAPGSDPDVQLDVQGRAFQLRVVPGPSGDTAEYLLTLPPGETEAIRALHLQWEDAGRNWQQQVSVSTGQSIAAWTSVANSRPIIDLRAGDERLIHAESPLGHVSPYSAQFWRLRFGPGFVPALTGVEAELESQPIDTPSIQLLPSTELSADGSLLLTLPSPQPVDRLHVYASELNSVLPFTIEVRRQNQPWRHVRMAVAYRLNSNGGEQVSPSISLNAGLIDAMRLRPLGTSWGSTAPHITLERNGLTLVVNARGAGPFLLAWGSRAASDTSIPLATLMPDSSLESLRFLEPASVSERMELGGDSRLVEATPGERASRTQTTIVWVLLVAGALALGALALTIYKEAKK